MFNQCPECGETNHYERSSRRYFDCGFIGFYGTREARCDGLGPVETFGSGSIADRTAEACYRLALVDAAQVIAGIGLELSDRPCAECQSSAWCHAILLNRDTNPGMRASPKGVRVSIEHQLLELASEPMLAWELDGKISYWNKACERLYGVTADLAIGSLREAVLRSPTITAEISGRLNSEGRWSGEVEIQVMNGRTLALECRLQLLGTPKPTVLEVHRDVTEHRQLANRLRETEARFKSIIAMSSHWYWEQDEQFRLTYISDSVIRHAGSLAASHIGKARWELPTVGVRDADWAAHRAHLDRHEPFRDFEYRRFNDQGEIIWLSVSGDPVFDTAGRFMGYRGTGRNITAQKRAEELLARSTERLEAEVIERTRQLAAMYDAAVNAILTIDPTGAIQSMNAATMRLLGYAQEELIGRNVRVIMPEPYASQHDGYLKSYVDTGAKKIIGIGREVTARRKDGTTFPIHLSVSEFQVNDKRYFTGIITDLTDRKAAELALRETERQLAQAQKMEAVGQLTGGLAHDFNNLLTVITGNLELLDMRVEGNEERDLIRRADEAARMGARLTGRLLTFSRRRALQPTVLNLNEMTVGMTELLRRTLGENINVITNLAPDLWHTRVDASEIENAILNLAINARDAMPTGGRIAIETSNVELGVGDLAQSGDATPGSYVKLSVSDTGVGMLPHVLARAFEPFFTTKDAGRGTGLGLSTVYGFVKQSGGHAVIYSEIGRGTSINLFFPREAYGATQASAMAQPAASLVPLGETILVVEDNEQVRHVTVKRLDALGYNVLIAEDGPSAIGMLEQRKGIQLVFSDVVMPGGVSGFDVLRWVQQHRPDIKVLLTSGFAPEAANRGDEFGSNTLPLRKPYTQAELARAVREALRG